jgi:hypothetical protein
LELKEGSTEKANKTNFQRIKADGKSNGVKLVIFIK